MRFCSNAFCNTTLLGEYIDINEFCWETEMLDNFSFPWYSFYRPASGRNDQRDDDLPDSWLGVSQISAMSVSGVTRALQRSLTEFSGKASQNNKNDNKCLEGASMVRQERLGGLTTSLPR